MYEEIVKDLNKNLEMYKEQYKILELVEPILKQFEGKKITARIETAVKKVLNPLGYTVQYFKDYSWYTLKVYGNGLLYDNAVRFNLGYENRGEFSFENFKSNNGCYYKNQERIEDIEVMLSDTDRIKSFIITFEEVKKLQSDFESVVAKTCIRHYFKF